MKFKHNTFNLVTAIAFTLAFFSLMMSYLTSFMFYPAMIFFCTGFILLSIMLIKNYKKQKLEREQKQDTIIMELASTENGEKYVMQSEKTNRKERRKKRLENFDLLLPSILSICASLMFVYFFASKIISLF